MKIFSFYHSQALFYIKILTSNMKKMSRLDICLFFSLKHLLIL